ncbi:MAG: glycosyltransferase family 4 protein [Chthoniobacteraceae bacterium]
MKLRIAQVAPLWTAIPPQTYGGIELLMALLIEELTARGHEVTLFASGDCRTSGTLRPVVDLNLSDLFREGRGYCFEYYANSTVAEVLAAQDQFDVVHFHMSSAWLPLAATMRPRPLFTLHTSPHHDDEWVMSRWPEVAVIGISRAQMRACSLQLGREFPVVYNGCDFSAYDPLFEPGKYLAFLGRFSPEKNPLGAIRLAQAAQMPIVLAGQPQNANEARYFEEHIRPLLNDDNIRWMGPANHPQKVQLLRAAAALLFPIEWEEPFGLVMIEAMACGTPVLAHRRGSVEEVIDQGVTGYHATSIDGMLELLGPTLALDRQAVRDQAKRRFGHLAMVEAYESLYRELLTR